MTQRPVRRARRSGAIAAFATIPAIALATIVAPCACPEHQQHAAGALANAAAPTHALPGASAAAPQATGHHATGTTHGPAATVQHAMPAGLRDMAWVVGTPQVPLVLRQDAGELALGDPPPVAAPIAQGARATAEPVAARSELTTAQATAKLSRRCRTLLKAKRPSRLSKSDRRKRSACLRQRRALIAQSATPTPAPTTPATPTPTPAATTPAPTPTPGAGLPTPTPTPAPCASPCVRALGVTAKDQGGRFIFTLTRATVEADRVSFQFENKDAQDHNLFVQPKDRPDLAQPVSTLLAPGGRATKELDLAPGTYTLRCLIEGHETMTVDITVTAPIR